MGLWSDVESWLAEKKIQREISRWDAKGKPSPPPHRIKQLALRNFRDQFDAEILVETGTFRGDMMQAMSPYFKSLYSIELAKTLYEKAVERFREQAHITILFGDSGKVLGELVPKLNGRTLFWLDGHYSAGETAKGEKETPIFEELDHIFGDNRFEHVVLVDDARLFGTDPAYPSLDELREFVSRKRPSYTLSVENDSVRLLPPLSKTAVASR